MIESYDGLCGIIHIHSSSECQIRCNYELGHSGEHSWAKRKVGLCLFARLPGSALSWFEKYCK